MDRLLAAHRLAHAERGEPGLRSEGPDVHLRADPARRVGGEWAVGARAQERADQDRALRAERDIGGHMDATNADLVLDGNAVAGVLVEIFGDDLTAAIGTCPDCGNTA